MIGFLHPLLERLERLWLENQPPPSRSLAATPPANDAACSGRSAAESLSLSGGAQITPRSSSNCTNSPCHRVVDDDAAAAAEGHLHHTQHFKTAETGRLHREGA